MRAADQRLMITIGLSLGKSGTARGLLRTLPWRASESVEIDDKIGDAPDLVLQESLSPDSQRFDHLYRFTVRRGTEYLGLN